MRYLIYDFIDVLKKTPGRERTDMWVCCFTWKYGPDKILRNVPPIHVRINYEEQTDPWRYYDKQIHAFDDHNKEVKLIANNGHGDCEIFDNYEECARFYNSFIEDRISKARQVRDSLVLDINEKIEIAEKSKIPGFISEAITYD